MSKVYQLVSKKEDDTTELLIHGDIVSLTWFESDVSSFDIGEELAKIDTSNLVVRINSYGGEAAVGLAIYNLLKTFKGKVTTINDGFACSAASVIFMAGQERVMPLSSVLMIHNAWTIGQGDSNDFRKLADDLEKITQPCIAVYKENSKLSETEIKKMLDREEWITADEALAYGFATRIYENGPRQSTESNVVHKLVMKTKELEKRLEEKQQPIEDGSWSSFFNGKKGN